MIIIKLPNILNLVSSGYLNQGKRGRLKARVVHQARLNNGTTTDPSIFGNPIPNNPRILDADGVARINTFVDQVDGTRLNYFGSKKESVILFGQLNAFASWRKCCGVHLTNIGGLLKPLPESGSGPIFVNYLIIEVDLVACYFAPDVETFTVLSCFFVDEWSEYTCSFSDTVFLLAEYTRTAVNLQNSAKFV
jgi:hypothetical protein